MKKLILLAALCGFFYAQNSNATCSNPASYVDGNTLTAGELNTDFGLVATCVDDVLNGDTFTGNISIHSGFDLLMYSNVGTTLKFAIDGLTGDFGMASGRKFYLDGAALSGGSYMTESSAGNIDIYAAGDHSVSFVPAGINLTGGDSLYLYSAPTYLRASIDGATGKIIGAPQKVGVYNLELVRATTTNAGDSIKIQCGGAACSGTNPGFVVMNGTTAGTLTTFYVDSNVTQLLTGAHWGIGTTGDISGAIIRALFVNDNETLRTCFAYVGGRDTVLTTDTNATQTNINTPQEILCNTAVASATNTTLEFGYVRADFDDTGGAAEDLWAVQSGVNDVVTGKSADGLWQNWNSSSTGFASDPISGTFRFTQVGRTITINVNSTPSTSDSTAFTIGLPVRPLYARNYTVARPLDNGAAVASGLISVSGGSLTATLSTAVGGVWTNSGNKAAQVDFSYEIGPSTSFID